MYTQKYTEALDDSSHEDDVAAISGALIEIVDSLPEFTSLLMEIGNLSDLKNFLLMQGREWDALKEILLIEKEGKYYIDDEKLAKVRNVVLERYAQEEKMEMHNTINTLTFRDSESDASYNTKDKSAKSSDTSSGNSITRSPIFTRSKGAIASQVIRGEVATYAQSMMGYFKCKIKEELNAEGIADDVLCVSDDTKIIRPRGIVGNLGRPMGEHVVPFSAIIRDILSRVKGKRVFEAINELRYMIAQHTSDIEDADQYQSLIDISDEYQGRDKNLKAQLKAFEFLRHDFIPSIIALNNQAIGNSFHGKKSAQQLADEVVLVKAFLAASQDDINEYIENFVSVVDYSPVSQSALLTSQQSLERGKRINHIDALSKVMGDVVEVFFRLYPVDAADSRDCTTMLVNAMLQQKGWVEYYRLHALYLGDEFFYENSEQGLRDYIVNHIKSGRAILFADAEQLETPESSSQGGEDIDSKGLREDSDHDANNEYYTEDQMVSLLRHYLPNEQQYYIAPQTQLEHAGLLRENVATAIAEANDGRIAVLHVNIHNNH